jgi:hypothetical protein
MLVWGRVAGVEAAGYVGECPVADATGSRDSTNFRPTSRAPGWDKDAVPRVGVPCGNAARCCSAAGERVRRAQLLERPSGHTARWKKIQAGHPLHEQSSDAQPLACNAIPVPSANAASSLELRASTPPRKRAGEQCSTLASSGLDARCRNPAGGDAWAVQTGS